MRISSVANYAFAALAAAADIGGALEQLAKRTLYAVSFRPHPRLAITTSPAACLASW